MLDSFGLQFLGFVLPQWIKKNYASIYTDDQDQVCLENWKTFEKTHPDTFKAMYQFWVQPYL